MGRPEKVKLRKLIGSPNVLFPIGDNKMRSGNIYDAIKKGFIKSDFPLFKCSWGFDSIYKKCRKCGKNCVSFGFCRKCNDVKDEKCKIHGDIVNFQNRRIDIKEYFNNAILKVGYKENEITPIIKGVKRLKSELKTPEDLSKGILRAKFNLNVNKDGTVRYDATEIPLTHFKPKEINTSVDKLRELGYLTDIDGKKLTSVSQILELKPHDIVLSNCSEVRENKADDVFFNITKFIDEELVRFYNLKSFYDLKNKKDLIGVNVVCIAPHNCAGVIGRIIGFSNMQGVLASPYMHAAMRRDCDGDECSIMLLMDVLLNFSREFLPSHRGGRQDAPLVLNARIRAGEVEDQILLFESLN